jgi:hypothetical protein
MLAVIVRRVVVVALGLAFVSATAAPAEADIRVVGSSAGTGDFAVASSHGSVDEPWRLWVKVKARPKQSVYVAWTVVCSQESGAQSTDGDLGDDPNPSSCQHAVSGARRLFISRDSSTRRIGPSHGDSPRPRRGLDSATLPCQVLWRLSLRTLQGRQAGRSRIRDIKDRGVDSSDWGKQGRPSTNILYIAFVGQHLSSNDIP